MTLTINSAQQMQLLGAAIAKTAQPNDLLLLTGDLGAGKTTLTQGIGQELGIKRPVKSPTFTIVREYQEARLPLYHMDMYRLANDDLASIDLESYLTANGLVVIEWPEMIADALPSNYLKLELKRVDDSWQSTVRQVLFDPAGDRASQWSSEILNEYN